MPLIAIRWNWPNCSASAYPASIWSGLLIQALKLRLNTIRAARALTGKSRFAKVEGGYHGTHDAVTVSLRIDPKKGGDAHRPKALPSTAGLANGVLEQVVIIPFNDTEAARLLLEENKDELAAVIVEPVMGSVGMVPASAEFLTMLREFTQDNGIVLIFDEVISFRVAPGGAQQYYGITPDMTALGKIIGGGFPVGAFGGRRDIMELYDPTKGPEVSHAGTFNANPVTMLAGAVTLKQLNPDVYPSLGGTHGALTSGHQRHMPRTGSARPSHGPGLAVRNPLYRRRST